MIRPYAVAMLLLSACGGSAGSAAGPAGDEGSDFAPLFAGADYAKSFSRINQRPFRSPDHGNRWVNTFANARALETIFAATGTFAVGSIVVKESFEDEGGAPSAVRGPVFVMEKRAPGYNPEGHDWWWALHWAKPVGAMAQTFPDPIYWRGKTGKVAYCWACHVEWSEHDGVAVGLPEDNLARPAAAPAVEELGGDAVEEVEDF